MKDITNPSFLDGGYWLQLLWAGESRRKVFQTLRSDDGTCMAWIPNSRKVDYGHIDIKGPEK